MRGCRVIVACLIYVPSWSFFFSYLRLVCFGISLPWARSELWSLACNNATEPNTTKETIFPFFNFCSLAFVGCVGLGLLQSSGTENPTSTTRHMVTGIFGYGGSEFCDCGVGTFRKRKRNRDKNNGSTAARGGCRRCRNQNKCRFLDQAHPNHTMKHYFC